MSHEHEVWQLLDALQMDLRTVTAKLTALRSQVAALELPDPAQFVCPAPCGARFRSAFKLAEHLYVSHDGPLPAHYAAIEERAG